MLWVVSPGSIICIDPVPGSIDIVSVVVAYEVVVVSDVDIVAAPTTAPSPTTTQTNSNRDARPVPDRRTTVIASVKSWIWIRPSSPNKHWVIRRHIDHFRTGLLNHHVALSFDLLCFDLDLLIRLQLASFFRFRTCLLYCVHHVRLLGQEGVSEVCGPIDILRKSLNDSRQNGHRLDTRIPVLFLNC